MDTPVRDHKQAKLTAISAMISIIWNFHPIGSCVRCVGYCAVKHRQVNAMAVLFFANMHELEKLKAATAACPVCCIEPFKMYPDVAADCETKGLKQNKEVGCGCSWSGELD